MSRSARDIAGYRLVASLGEGGMARVYLARSKKAAGFSKLVVLKVIRSSATHDPELRRMFFDEARVAALLNHPNVVQTYDAGEDEGRLFLAMEYLEGKTLSSMTEAGRPRVLPLDVHLRIIADMLAGLHYAHGVPDDDGRPLDVVHRDVSPQNVLVTFVGQSKVVDFGIAKIAGSPMTQSGIIKGKVGYIAPEQIHNKTVDRRADIFSAGVMIWEALAGRRLVPRGEDDVASIGRRMNGDDPSVRTVAPAAIDEELLAICDKAMSFSADDRHATALELHEALDKYLRRTDGADQKRVAEVLESAYGEERRRTRAFIEAQAKVADESNPLIDVPRQTTVTLTAPVPASGEHGLAVSAPIPPSEPNVPSAPSIPPPAPSNPPMMPVLQRESNTPPTDVASVADLAPVAARSSKRTFTVVGLLGALALMVGAVSLIGARTASAPGAAASTAPRSSTSSEGANASADGASSAVPDGRVRLVVRTSPESATLVIDGVAQTKPYQATVARGATVRVEARAAGFSDYDRTVTVDDDTNLLLALSRPGPAPGTASAPSRPPVGAAAGAADPGKAGKKRSIDNGDPYRQ